MALTREQLLQYTGGSNRGEDILEASRKYGFSPADVDQAYGFEPGYSQSWLDRNMQSDPAPTYGLGGAESALMQGAQQGLNQIGQTQQDVADLYRGGVEALSPYRQAGGQANDLQAALSGALGPEAQQQAFSNYMASPGVEFAQGEAERALKRNASATGGLGGGNLLRDLTQLAAQTFAQDFGNQYGRIGQVANRGYNAASTTAGLQGQQAGVQSGLGQFAANIPMSIGSETGQYRYQAGRDIASNIAQTTSALSNLVGQQGTGLSNLIGQNVNSINNLFQAAGEGDARAKEQLTTILANLGVNAGSQYSSQPLYGGQTSNYMGGLGQVASGVGGFMQYYDPSMWQGSTGNNGVTSPTSNPRFS